MPKANAHYPHLWRIMSSRGPWSMGYHQWCPIQHNTDACVHRSANNLDLSTFCGSVTFPVGDCQDREYDLIVTTKDYLKDVSRNTPRMVVLGENVGEDLDHFVQKNSRWIIDVMGGKGYEVLTSSVDPERLAFQKELDRLQHRCTNFFTGAKGTYGFGSNWHTTGLALAHSMYYNMTLYPVDVYNNFIRSTTCTDADMQRAFTAHHPESDFNKWNASTINFKSEGVDVHHLMWHKEIIKPEFQNKGLFWWRSMLTYYITRPNFKLREAIRQRSTISAPCISIHVRHSDKDTEATLLDFPKYMEVAKEVKAKTGISNIYLMSDDPVVISSTKSREYRNFRFHYMDVPRTNKGWESDAKDGVFKVQSVIGSGQTIMYYGKKVGKQVLNKDSVTEILLA
ncbi:hypothetical protein BGZ79_006847, partial [Entomortierella chlamydospora]